MSPVYLNLVGQVFGRLTAIAAAPSPEGCLKKSYFLCRCECGKETVVSSSELRSGGTRSCGCLRIASNRKKEIDLTGKRFERLTVIGKASAPANNHRVGSFWYVQCQCQSPIFVVHGGDLRDGNTQSCGCLSRQKAADRLRTHGLRDTPEFNVWARMRARCQKSTHPDFEYYGGRGILVCEEWSSFAQFLADMGKRPSSLHTIDRIDNNGPYCKSNCRWATRKQQANNQRSNMYIEYDGRIQTLAQWSDELSIPYTTLRSRLSKGWEFQRAIITPISRTVRKKSQ
jgi:hypothetical protein